MQISSNISGRIDFGPEPYVVNIECATTHNSFYRRTLWTGKYLQVTLMSIPVGGEIGLEVHPETDQFLRIEEGKGMALLGKCKERADVKRFVENSDAIVVPAGTWHNVVNVGSVPLKLYSIYAPPHHPFATVHRTKAEADAEGD